MIQAKGSTNAEFFVIINGEAVVEGDHGENVTLSAGDYIGATSMLNGKTKRRVRARLALMPISAKQER